MSKFALVPIGELCREMDERSRSRDLPVYSVSKNLGILPQSERFKKRVASADTKRYKVLEPGDLAYDPMLLWSGSVARNDTGKAGVISPAYTVFRTNDRVRSTYLLRYLQMEGRLPFYESISHGTNERRRKAHFADFAELTIPLPPLAEQDRMVALLDEADALRKLRAQAESRTAQLIPAIFQEMFGEGMKRHEWSIVPLSEVVAEGKTVTYGIVQAGPHIPEGVPYIKTGDIKNGEVAVDGLMRTSKEIAESYRRSEVRPGDIVMSIRATVGTTAIVPDSLPLANLTQGTARIRPGHRTNKHFLNEYIRLEPTQRWIAQHVKGTTFREITLTELRKLPVALPPLKLQDEFAARVSEVRALQAAQGAARGKVEALWGSLLGEVFG